MRASRGSPGVVAVLRVGAPTDVEREARRSQIEDALAATRAAVEEGIVPGGGVALLRASARLESLSLKPLEAAGRDIVAAALAEPARQIAMNAGAEGDAVIARLRSGVRWFGYDALTGEYGELDRAGTSTYEGGPLRAQNAGALGGSCHDRRAVVDDGGRARSRVVAQGLPAAARAGRGDHPRPRARPAAVAPDSSCRGAGSRSPRPRRSS